jgi:hypothetical protein
MIDSGASRCLFHASFGHAIGIVVEKGEEEKTMGVSGQATTVYLHDICLYIPGGHILRIRAGFTNDLPIAGLLGRRGFFDSFKISFDPAGVTPGFDIERFYVA